MLSNKSVKMDRKHVNKIMKEFGDPNNIGRQAEAFSKIAIEKQLGVKVEKADDPPDLKFYQDGKCIGVEVTCLFEVVDLTKNGRKVSSQHVQEFLKGIAQKVQNSLAKDASITFPKDVCLDLTRFGGYLISSQKGAHYATNPSTLPTRVEAPDRRACARWSLSCRVGQRV